jgi:hypothetical protein
MFRVFLFSLHIRFNFLQLIFFKWSSSRCIDTPTPIHVSSYFCVVLVVGHLLPLEDVIDFLCLGGGGDDVSWWWASGAHLHNVPLFVFIFHVKFSLFSWCFIAIYPFHVVLGASHLLVLLVLFLCWSPSSSSCVAPSVNHPFLFFVLLLC